MRNLLFVLVSTAIFAMMSPAIAQYPGIGRGDPPPLPPPSDWGSNRGRPPSTSIVLDRSNHHHITRRPGPEPLA